MDMKSDVLIVGSGVSGLYCALNLPRNLNITLITKDTLENSNSFLAQGGICVLKDSDDYEAFFNDTLKSGHYENNPETVTIMINSSQDMIQDLIQYGVQFDRQNGQLLYTKEGAHSRARILFHKDVTGKEITQTLLDQVKSLKNVKLLDFIKMKDLIIHQNSCVGIVAEDIRNNCSFQIKSKKTVLATGGIGGLYKNSTNQFHLTGDSIEIAKKHKIKCQNLDYVQMHPTTLYSQHPGQRFLISESVRGEGAHILDKNGHRFIDELLARDVLTNIIHKQMEKDQTDHVWLKMSHLGKEKILAHFPNIYSKCLSVGYDVCKDSIPIVPAQHYFMGGIEVKKIVKLQCQIYMLLVKQLVMAYMEKTA